MRTYLGLVTNAVRSALRSKHDLMLENLALRQQLAVLTHQRARTPTKPADRLFWSWRGVTCYVTLAVERGSESAGTGHIRLGWRPGTRPPAASGAARAEPRDAGPPGGAEVSACPQGVEVHAPLAAFEERGVEMLLEGSYVVGNGRHRDAQFGRGAREALVAGRGFEEAQALKRGQARHGLGCPYRVVLGGQHYAGAHYAHSALEARPPRSAYFVPKLPTGIVLHPFD